MRGQNFSACHHQLNQLPWLLLASPQALTINLQCPHLPCAVRLARLILLDPLCTGLTVRDGS